MKLSQRSKIILWVSIIPLTIICFYSTINFFYKPHGGIPQVDSKKIGDLKTIEIGLDLYYDKNLKYPHVVGENPNERWRRLSEELVVVTGLKQTPNDRRFPEWSYDYQDGEGAQHYVLKAKLEVAKKANPLLNNDADGIIFGINCGDNSGTETEYCVTR